MKMKRKKKVLQVPKLESLKQINPNAAGVDVGASELYVCVPEDRDPRPVRVFQTFTSDLHEIAAWLKRCRVTSVAMESTGIYWIFRARLPPRGAGGGADRGGRRFAARAPRRARPARAPLVVDRQPRLERPRSDRGRQRRAGARRDRRRRRA